MNKNRTVSWQVLTEKRWRTLLSLILWASLFTFCDIGRSQTLDREKLDLLFDRLSENNEAMGSLSLSKEGEELYARSIGLSQVTETEKVPMTSKTRHRVGSITKMFTAVLILQLAEEGKLNLDDHLDRFFPEIPVAHKISIRQVMAHRSGVHDIMADPKLRPRRRTSMLTKEEMLGLISKGGSDFEPGSQYAYSNSGYFLLGYLVEKMTGQTYAQAIQERILAKINLKETYPAYEKINTGKSEAFSYAWLAEWKRQPQTHWSMLFGSGSLISTPSDLAKFIEALFDSKLVSEESLSHMITIRDGYGLGLDTFTFAGKTFFGHTGGIDGFGSWLAYLPEEKLTIAYATNAKVYPVSKIISGVADIYFNRPYQVPTFQAITVSPEILAQYAGSYEREGAPVKFTITHEVSTLFISMNGSPNRPLEATAENVFKLESQGMILEFDVKSNEMTIRRGAGVRVFTKATQ